MDRSGQSRSTEPVSQQRIQALVERFRAAPVDLGAYLPPMSDPLRRAVLLELIRADLDLRWGRGQSCCLEHYLERFPELGSAAYLPAALIYDEYRIREQHGDHPQLAAYQQRFPEQYAQVEQRVREGHLPSAPPSALASGTVYDAATPSAPPFVAPVVNQETKIDDAGALPGYKLLQRLGSGSFAEVWQGEAPGGFRVAIKRIIRPLDDLQAQRELLALKQMKHLHHIFLLQNHAYFLVDNHLYVVMELADGTLRDRMKECQGRGQPGLPVEEAIRYFHEAAEALDYMHSQNVLHRDVKPQNILLLNGHAKVADFGLALLLESQRTLLSASGSGTPAYMAPEVWRRKISPRSDQYSLAFAYAEQRLGRWPFASRDLHGLMLDHLETDPNLEGLSAAEQGVLRRALAKKPEDRFPSCVEFMHAAEQAVTGAARPGPVPSPQRAADSTTPVLPSAPARAAEQFAPWASSTTQSLPTPATRPLRRWRRLALAALVLIVALIGGVLAWQSWRPALDAEAVTKLNIEAPAPAAGDWEKAEGAELIRDRAGQAHYNRIEVVRDGMRVPFVLVPQQRASDPPTFYIMEDKVWVELFARFAAQPGTKLSDTDWKRYEENKVADHPVLGVTVADADQFARWLGGLLPMPKQWDKAAGRYEEPRGAGPSGKPADQSFGLKAKLMKRGEPTADVSCFGCRHLSANGLEWTGQAPESEEEDPDKRTPSAELPKAGWIIMRGGAHDAEQPLTFKALEKREIGAGLAPPTQNNPVIGFRVVRELGR